jgi:hypothetical protein
MTKLLKNATGVMLAVSMGLAQAVTVQRYAGPDASGAICKPSGVMVGYFNGVNTDYSAARLATRVLNYQYGNTTPSGEKMFYETFYNRTDGLPTDVIETMNLRLGEIDARLKNRYDLILKTLLGDIGWARALGSVSAALHAELESKLNGLLPNLVASFSRLIGNPQSTNADLAANQQLLEKYKTEGKKFVLVAHSEGNLFANRAYNYVTGGSFQSVAKVIHVAPASTELHGDYVLGDMDLVINGLRLMAPGDVPANNWPLIAVFGKEVSSYLELAASNAVTVGDYATAFVLKTLSLVTGIEYREPDDILNATDWMGHGFFEIYNNPNKTGKTQAGRSRLNTVWTNTLAEVDATARQNPIADGFFTVTMTWDQAGDIDLHTLEPAGTHVYYSNRSGQSGYLDRDDTVATGPEHYYASCAASALQTGNYNFGVVNYYGVTGTTATLQVYDYQQRLLGTYSTVVGGPTRSSGMPGPLFTLSVATDPNTGEYIVTLP